MPDESIALAPAEVHLWRIALDSGDESAAARVLAPDERPRAARFRLIDDRRRFTIARAGLRRILARYLGAAATDVRFVTSVAGKPRLETASGRAPRFSLSRSRDVALLAVSSGRDVGVDVEAIHAGAPLARLAAEHYAPSEAAMLSALPDESRAQAFFRLWCRKEAYLKARGTGLVDRALGEPLDAGAPHQSADGSLWRIVDLPSPTAGFVAALAIEGDAPLAALRYRSLE